jgi:hypothetical protein
VDFPACSTLITQDRPVCHENTRKLIEIHASAVQCSSRTSHTNSRKVANCTLHVAEHSLDESVFCLQNVSQLHTSPYHFIYAHENITTLTVSIVTKLLTFPHNYLHILQGISLKSDKNFGNYGYKLSLYVTSRCVMIT